MTLNGPITQFQQLPTNNFTYMPKHLPHLELVKSTQKSYYFIYVLLCISKAWPIFINFTTEYYHTLKKTDFLNVVE